VSVCKVVGFKPNSTAGPFDHCQDASPPDNQVFINAFIIAVAPLPANIWTIFHMDKLGRKFFLGIWLSA
jgi:VNT family MFS transporter (synaptic vesicle glycoprotein 2)